MVRHLGGGKVLDAEIMPIRRASCAGPRRGRLLASRSDRKA